MHKIKNLIFLPLFLVIVQIHGLTIDKSGTYKLRANYSDAISITANDVVLNLGGFTVTSSTDTTNIINIGSNRNNVVVCNGTISGGSGSISQTGIHITSDCSDIHMEEIRIHNLNTTTTGYYGIHVDGAPGSLITDSSIKNCTITNSTTNSGILIDYCNRIQIEQCEIIDNIISSGISACIGSTNSTNATIQKNEIKGNTSASNYYSLYFSSTTDSLVTDINIMNNITTGSANFNGVYLLSSAQNMFNNCTALGNTSVSSFYGFYSTGASHKNLFEACRVLGNSASDDLYGFYFTNSEYPTLVDCIASANSNNNSSGSNLPCIGFYFYECTAHKTIRCFGINNKALGAGDGATGFFSTGTSGADGLFLESIVLGNSGTLTSEGIVKTATGTDFGAENFARNQTNNFINFNASETSSTQNTAKKFQNLGL